MEFRLIYQGPLPSETSRPHPDEKHVIRRQLHPQLRELWMQHKFLRNNIEVFAKRWHRGPFRFVPLVTAEYAHACSVDILFLRRDHPGNIIRSGGDIDNRLKVLFDGLRMADTVQLPKHAKPESGEDPFFCLLEDDNLITEIKVTTDRLLVPQREAEGVHDVVLMIHVAADIVGVDNGNDFVFATHDDGKIIEY